MAIATLAPTVYTLSGDCARIEYSTTSFVGRPSFHYKTDDTELRLQGDEIRVIDSEFGTLVTVTVADGMADAVRTTLTLIVPTVTVSQAEPTTTFDTKAVLMELRRSGHVHQTYKVLNLRGTAESIPF